MWSWRKRTDEDFGEEIRANIALDTDRLIAEGLSPGEARAAALRAFGNVTRSQEHFYESRRVMWLEEAGRDLLYAIRSLTKTPSFSGAVILSLALGLGVNIVMFSVLHTVLLRPLPYPSAEQLMMLWIGGPGQNGRPAYLTVEEWRRQSQSFSDMAVVDPVSVTLTHTDGAERISVGRASPNFFPLLGVQPLQGRTYSFEEAEQRQALALISYRFWQTHFGGSKDTIGASIVLDGRTSQIIGILPADVDIPGLNADVWEPHTLFPDWTARRGASGAGSWFVVGRLRPNVTVEQAQSEMTAIATALADGRSAAEGTRGITVAPLSLYVVGARSRLSLWMLTGAVSCVLLIAAANVASLSLARGVGRAREMAIRTVLGASPLRIVRQLLVESVTLATVAGVLGTLLAAAGIRVIRALGPGDLARLDQVGLDWSVLAWALLLSLLTGIFIGLAPAIATVRGNLRDASQASGRRVTGGLAARRIRRAFVVAELALCMVLLAGAGLLVRSWINLDRVDPGFAPARVLSMNILTTTTAVATPAQRASLYADILDQVESIPGVESAGLIGDLFINGGTDRIITTAENLEGAPERLQLRVDEVSDRLFATLRTPLLGGRLFSVDDRSDAPPVAIVNETMARRLWQGRNAVGERFKFGPRDSDRAWITVVGVVSDMRRQGLELEPIAQMFEPLAQNPSGNETLLVRTSTDDPLTMAATVQAAVRRVAKQEPLYQVTTLEARLEGALRQRRLQTALLIGFSVVALVMAAIGIYGLIHYSVTIRQAEIGIRMAVGARASDIRRMIVREGTQLTMKGLALGLMGALVISRIGSSLLFGVEATDPLTFTAVSLLLAVVAVGASYWPARRATKIDPLVALRCE